MRFAAFSALAVLAVASLCGAIRADDAPDPEAAYRKARAECLPRLESFAAWCDEQKLPIERYHAFEAILQLEPDNAAARKALRSTRGKDGKWSKLAAPPSGRTDPLRLGEVKTKRDEAIAPMRTAALDLAAATEARAASRERALEDLIGVAPDDEDARAANHEVRSNDKWVLAETAEAKAKRREVLGKIEEARAAAAPAKAEATDGEREITPKWSEVRTVPSMRVLGAQNVFETETVARNVEAVRAGFEAVTGDMPPAIPNFRLLFFADPQEAFAAIDRDPRFTADDRKFARGLDSVWAPSSADVYVWAAAAPNRVEWGARQPLGEYMKRQYGVTDKVGWAWEGIGHWFSEVVCGTHKCLFVRQSEYADAAAKQSEDLRKRLIEGPADWMGEGRDLEKSGRWPDLRLALGRAVDTMTPEDLLVSYLFARYLLDGRSADVADVLRAAGSSVGPDKWVAERFGMTIEGLDKRLRRFVRESR